MKWLLEEVSILKCNGFLIPNQVASKSDGVALYTPLPTILDNSISNSFASVSLE